MSLQTILIGAGAGFVAGLIVRFWNRSKEKITADIVGITDRIEKALGDIPDSIETAYANIVRGAVSVIDAQFANKKFWRDIINLISGKNPELAIDKFLEVFQSVDWSDSLKAQIPAEYLALFNWAREQLALRNVKAEVKLLANTVTAPQAAEVLKGKTEDAAIVEDIKTVVAANRYDVSEPIQESEQKVIKNIFAQLAEESRKRKEALQKN